MWTKTPPAAPGFYWVWPGWSLACGEKLPSPPYVVEVSVGPQGAEVHLIGWECGEPAESDQFQLWWSDPIPLPPECPNRAAAG